MKRHETHLDKLIAVKLSFDILLLDRDFGSHILQFLHLLMRYILRVATLPSATGADPMTYAKGPHFRLPNNVVLPLREAPPVDFRMYPEFFVE